MASGPVRVGWRAGPLLLWVSIVVTAAGSLMVAGAAPAPAYRDSPPAGYTGGMGEPSCDVCHFFNEPNDPAGSFMIDGIPERYEPATTYPLSVRVSRPGASVAGFQLTARFATGGEQAGTFTLPSEEADRVRITRSRSIEYVHHVLAGTTASADTTRWTLLWRSPADDREVTFSAAANAADGDDSVSGDFIYTVEKSSRGR